MAGHEWEDWFEREEFIGQISDIRVQNLQVERELVQKRTFTRWINLHLEKCDPPIEINDLFRDIQDGHILMALLEELSGCKLLHGFKKSSHRIFRLNNIAKVLAFLEERNVKLVSIDAADVADGNSSIILGLIWNIILFFQIKELTGNIRSQFPSSSSLSSIPTSSDSDTSHCSTPSDEKQLASTVMREHSRAIKKLLQWVQKRTRKYGVAVQDFGKSWTSGLAFLAVIKSIDPSLVDMRKALLRNARENLEDAFRIAHYSLGIPRLLEPEDVTIDAPDEQSIMMYVSQFLEHFPGIEEPEEPCQVIERSISMGRLNFRELDTEYRRNTAYRGRVKERTYMFQKDCSQPPPRILISSVSEDRGIMSPPFKPPASRSWSTEDFLSESPQFEVNASSVVEGPKEQGSVMPNSPGNSPQLSHSHSPTGSSVPESVNTESVMGDSAISSPDSWEDSEYGLMQEKFCESRSDSSLCDSGTTWDVYHATPVEVTPFDEGFVPTLDKEPDDQLVTESFIDEGIFSLSSLDTNLERIQQHAVTELQESQEQKEEEKNLENHKQESEEQVHQNKEEISKGVSTEQIDTSQSQEVPIEEDPAVELCDAKDKALIEQEPASGLCDTEKLPHSDTEQHYKTDQIDQSQCCANPELPPLVKFEEFTAQSSVSDTSQEYLEQSVDFSRNSLDEEKTNKIDERGSPEVVEEDLECHKTESLKEEKRQESIDESKILKEIQKDIIEKEETSEGSCPDPQGNISTETYDENTDLVSQGTDSETNSEQCIGMNIPVISISSEMEGQDIEGTSDIEEREHAGNENVFQTKEIENKENNIHASMPEDLLGHSYDTSEDDAINPARMLSCTPSENISALPSKQISDIEDEYLEDTDDLVIQSSCGTIDRCEPDTIENLGINVFKEEYPNHNQEADISYTNMESQLVDTGHDTDCINQPNGQEESVGPDFETDNTEQNLFVNMQTNGSKSREIDTFYADTDQQFTTEDLTGAFIEPMDLFYPDKEEAMFTEPVDTEMQSWPSVLSVSALQPAPASETLLEDQPINLMNDDLSNGLSKEQDQVISEPSPMTDNASEPQEQYLLSGEKTGLLLRIFPTDSCDLSEAEILSPDPGMENTEPLRCYTKSSIRQEESQMPPSLRQRKGVRFSQNTNNQRDTREFPTKADEDISDSWWSESWELYLLLLLWLLLYCFWLLPQMDLETLPRLLFNLNH